MSGTLNVLWLSRHGIRTYLRARDTDLDLLQRQIAAYIVNHPNDHHHYRDLANTLDAQPLAVALVAEDFASRELALVVKTMGDNLHINDTSESLRRMLR